MDDQPRLKAEIWVKALIRRLDAEFITAMVARIGDPQAGAVYLKVNDLKDGCQVFSRSYGQDGRRIWAPATGDLPVGEQQADEYIARQIKYDTDCWVVEIENLESRFNPTILE